MISLQLGPDVNSRITTSITPTQQIRKTRWCTDCNEQISNLEGERCVVCGSNLEVRFENINSNSLTNSVDYLRDMFGDELFELFEASLSDLRPSRQISKKYLSSVGRVVVDSNKTILRDVTIEIGRFFKFMAVAAAFGYNFNDWDSSVPIRIRIANPITGETTSDNSIDFDKEIVVMERGAITFARKAINCLNAGAAAALIIQTSDIWPFVMTDASDEFLPYKDLSDNRRFPVLMISKRDGKLLQRFLATNEGKNQPACIRCYNPNQENMQCSICCEDMLPGEEVLKLHCRHAYHSQCVESWLEKQNTCPMCRMEMPTQTVEESGRKPPSATDNITVPYFL